MPPTVRTSGEYHAGRDDRLHLLPAARVGRYRRIGRRVLVAVLAGVTGRDDDHRALDVDRVVDRRAQARFVDRPGHLVTGRLADVDDLRPGIGRMHHRAGQAAQRAGGLGGVRVVGIGARADRLKRLRRLAQRQNARIGRDADEPVGGGGPAGDDRRGERSVRIAVGHAVAALVDEIAAGLRGHPRRAVHPGVDDGDSYPGAGCELLRFADPQVVVRPRLVGEVRIRERRGGRADAALFRRLVRTRLVGWHGGRVDRRRLDRCGGGSAEQRQYQRHQQHTNAVHVYEPPSAIAPARSVLVCPQQSKSRPLDGISSHVRPICQLAPGKFKGAGTGLSTWICRPPDLPCGRGRRSCRRPAPQAVAVS